MRHLLVATISFKQSRQAHMHLAAMDPILINIKNCKALLKEVVMKYQPINAQANSVIHDLSYNISWP
jgi:hypothetical protein